MALLVASQSGAQGVGSDSLVRTTGFERYTTTDSLGRTITYFLSRVGDSLTRPLAVFIQGSGCTSVFTRSGNRISGGYQNVLKAALGQAARVLVVEKPGVTILDRPEEPGTAMHCSRDFLEQHTLERWSTAVAASLDDVIRHRSVDSRHILVVGHSEGGIVAARVALLRPAVTHVAVLSGSGPTQLFDLASQASRQSDTSRSGDPTAPVFEAWARIQADPSSTTAFYAGHPYRRWASFLAASTFDDLSHTAARIFLAAGTEDRNVPIASFDVMRAELVRRGGHPTVERISGADHSFDLTGEQPPAGMARVFGHIRDWFLQ